MAKFQVIRKHKNPGLLFLVIGVYVVLLGYFAWQTILFTGIIFPDSDLQVKILTVFSVDGMGFVWACLHTFYSFAHPHAKTAVKWGWGITYFLSALLSALYIIFTFILDFSHVTDLTYVKIGVGLSLAALMFNLGMISIFLYLEIKTRFPQEDDYEIVEEGNKNSSWTVPGINLLTRGKKNSQVTTEELDAAIVNKKKGAANGHTLPTS